MPGDEEETTPDSPPPVAEMDATGTPQGVDESATGTFSAGPAGNDGDGDSRARFTIQAGQQSSTDSPHAMEIAVRRLSCCAPTERTKRLQQTDEGSLPDIKALEAGVQNNDPYLADLIKKELQSLKQKKEPTTELGKLVKKYCPEDVKGLDSKQTEDLNNETLITTLKNAIPEAPSDDISISSDDALKKDNADKIIVDALISDLTQESYHKNSYMHKIQKETTNRLGVDRRRRSYFSATKSVKPIKARASKNPLGLLSKNYRITYNEESNSFEISFGGRVSHKEQAKHLFDTVVSAGLLGSDQINITLNTKNPNIARKQTEALIKEANQRGIPLSTLKIRTPNLQPSASTELGIAPEGSTLKSVLEQERVFLPKLSGWFKRKLGLGPSEEDAAKAARHARQQYQEQNARHEDPDYKEAYRVGGSYLDPEKRVDLVHPNDYQKTQPSADLDSEEEASTAAAEAEAKAKRLITRTKVSTKPDISDFNGCFQRQGNQVKLHPCIEKDTETKEALQKQIKACPAQSDKALAEQVNKYRLLEGKGLIDQEELMKCIITAKSEKQPNPSAQSLEGQAIDRSTPIHPGKTPKFSTFIQSAAYKNLDEETLSPRQNALLEAEIGANDAQERAEGIELTTLPTGQAPEPTPGQDQGLDPG